MPLITEDGSVVAGAESLCSVAAADTYHSNRANTAWAALGTPAKEANLRKATDYMEQVYRLRWKGARISTAQLLDWPRYGVRADDVGFISYPAYIATNIVPTEVQNACAELALKASTADLAPDVDREILAETIGPIHTEYRAGAPQYKMYRAIDLMLKIYLEPMGAQLVRA